LEVHDGQPQDATADTLEPAQTMKGLNWGYYCVQCAHYYYGTRECPLHRPPYREMVRATLLDILGRLDEMVKR
jgi:hypothetical protein